MHSSLLRTIFWALGSLLLLTGCYTTPSALKASGNPGLGQRTALSGKVTVLVSLPGVDSRLYLLSDAQTGYPLLSKKVYQTGETVDFHGTVWSTKAVSGLPGTPEFEALASYLEKYAILAPGAARMALPAVSLGLKGVTSLSESFYLLVQE